MQVIGRVFIREPWAREIVQNRKTIETAHISLPVRFAGFWLHVQNEQREIIGAVKLMGVFMVKFLIQGLFYSALFASLN